MSASRLLLPVVFVFFTFSHPVLAQKSKSQLEREKQENLKKIAEAQKILSETSSQKKVTLGQLRALNQQINARESLIAALGAEVTLLDGEIDDLTAVALALQNDLKVLKKEYAEQIYATYKANQGKSKLMFIFSAKSFNQLFKRLKYLDQYADARRVQAQQIEAVTAELNEQRSKVVTKRAEQQTLLNQQLKESRKLSNAKRKQSDLVAQLTRKERQLKKELAERRAADRRLNSLIANIITEEERKDSNASTAEMASTAELTRLFESRKNRLTWPVASGFISSKFGKQPHPILKRITIINDGVDIQTQENATVKAVFDGEVTRIATIPGKNNIVIIRHGDYMTVYARLNTVNVKSGQLVKASDVIGEVHTNREGVSELEFQVYKGTTKLNPENWLALK
ncbi:MAG: peptidoglycan DD-metalloendopeptidase family protein [Bacteroidota bacterium]